MSLESQVRQFNTTYGKPMSSKPRLPTKDEAALLVDLLEEELQELKDAIAAGDLVEISDAITDIIYVAGQQGTTLGLPIDSLLQEVQRSNLSKLGIDGKPIYREDGKVLKGPNFSEPQIAKVLMGELYDSLR